MGQGYDFVREAAIRAAKAQYDKLFSSNAVPKQDCQPAQLSQDRKTATYADGTTGPVSSEGDPGDYAIICNGIAQVPDTRISFLGGGNNALVAGFDAANDYFYLRNLNSLSGRYQIPLSGVTDDISGTLDDRILSNTIQVQLAPDGKGLVAGGFFQNVPTPDNPNGDYHTYANWMTFTNVSLTSGNNPTTSTLRPPACGFINYDFVQSQLVDVTGPCNNVISAPVSQGPGSAAIYKLFPSNSDLFLPSFNTVDGSAGYAEARFFPAVNQTYTKETDAYFVDFFVCGQTLGPFGPFTGSGQYLQTWVNDTTGSNDPSGAFNGQSTTNALFMMGSQPVSFTSPNMLYKIGVSASGNSLNLPTGSYIVDIISDITYSTIYQQTADYITTDDKLPYIVPYDGLCFPPSEGGSSSVNTCEDTILQASSYTMTWDGNYPYEQPFYNSMNDLFVINGTIIPQPVPQLIYTTSGTSVYTDHFGPLTVFVPGFGEAFYPCAEQDGTFTYISTGSTSATYTDFGPLCGTADCVYFLLQTQETNSAGACITGVSCGGPGEDDDDDFAVGWDSNNFQITDWDGTFFSIDNYGPVQGITSFMIFPGDGGCNHSGGCPGTNGFYSINASFGTWEFSGGFFNAYRFGRGLMMMEGVTVLSPPLDNTSDWTLNQDFFLGPEIVLMRLQSPENQNHLFNSFRSLQGNTAVVYQDADPYIPPNANVPNQSNPNATVSVDQILDNPGLFDGQYIPGLSGPPASAGSFNNGGAGNSLTSGNGFSEYFWGSPTINTSAYTPVDTTNLSNSANRPDVFTDMILAPSGSWPFPYTYLRAVDSLIVDGLSQITTTPLTGTPTIQNVVTVYNVEGPTGDTPGLTTSSTVVTGSADPNEVILDFLIPLGNSLIGVINTS